MADNRFCVAVIGHSFIRRLNIELTRLNFARNYDLKEYSVFHRGLGGLKACDSHNGYQDAATLFKDRFREYLLDIEPTIVILQLGENDLDSPAEPLIIANALEEISLMLVKDFGVKSVFICELFTRRNPNNVSVELYHEKRLLANRILRTLVDSHDAVRFWTHKRIFQAQTPIFAADGVHLSPFGQRRFYRSLRHAIMTAIRSSY
ncbi:uncharacterized protein LOC123543022 [Mercenaria mercenaria]|uniref:uncharacterized protein LOC123543022 n=1 Tax=Mercenaria mercenaria TaxID=6596 RepID=UPI00234EA3FC|nr:uncharacterized protein LOC123543022 [Mercenaria mercenaria]